MFNYGRAEALLNDAGHACLSDPEKGMVFRVDNLDRCRDFYVNALGCEETPGDCHKAEFLLYGQTIICESDLAPRAAHSEAVPVSDPSLRDVPISLDAHTWNVFAKQIKTRRGRFTVAPFVRFTGTKYCQAELVAIDPWGNILVFKLDTDARDNPVKRRLFRHLGALVVVGLLTAITYALFSGAPGATLQVPACAAFHPCLPWP